MSPGRHDLMTEPLIRVRGSGRETGADLPTILARLAAGEEIEFPGLQAHQRHPWHAFLVQLGAIACHRSGWSAAAVPVEADAWRQGILALTDGAPEPWCLVVADLEKAAFLQPPVPEGDLKALPKTADTVGDLDVIITSKNHELKAGRNRSQDPEAWLFALVVLQTFQGYLGPGNYGISRMNGGFASRPGVGLAPRLDWAAQWRRDLGLALDRRPRIIEEIGYHPRNGVALTWTVPWDGETPLTIPELDPFFLEICRRIRLVDSEGRLEARKASSRSARVDAKDLNGHSGDLWTPIRNQDGAALTLSDRGFHTELTAQILLGTDQVFRLSPSTRPRPEDGPTPVFIARALVRGQGKTPGYFERVVPLPAKAASLLRRLTDDESASPENDLARRAQSNITAAKLGRGNVLRPAVAKLLSGAGPDRVKGSDGRIDPWAARYDRWVDDAFFETLWEDCDLDAEAAERRWQRSLVAWIRRAFSEACDAVALPTARLYPARAEAQGLLEGLLHKIFPDAFLSTPSPTEGAPGDAEDSLSA